MNILPASCMKAGRLVSPPFWFRLKSVNFHLDRLPEQYSCFQRINTQVDWVVFFIYRYWNVEAVTDLQTLITVQTVMFPSGWTVWSEEILWLVSDSLTLQTEQDLKADRRKEWDDFSEAEDHQLVQLDGQTDRRAGNHVNNGSSKTKVQDKRRMKQTDRRRNKGRWLKEVQVWRQWRSGDGRDHEGTE